MLKQLEIEVNILVWMICANCLMVAFVIAPLLLYFADTPEKVIIGSIMTVTTAFFCIFWATKVGVHYRGITE